jgi:hypothetical protein
VYEVLYRPFCLGALSLSAQPAMTQPGRRRPVGAVWNAPSDSTKQPARQKNNKYSKNSYLPGQPPSAVMAFTCSIVAHLFGISSIICLISLADFFGSFN